MLSCPGRDRARGRACPSRSVYRVHDLVFLRDLDLFRVHVALALLGGVDDAPVEPHTLDRVAVRIVVVEVLNGADLPHDLFRARNARVDLPQALARLGSFRHFQDTTPLAPELRSVQT